MTLLLLLAGGPVSHPLAGALTVTTTTAADLTAPIGLLGDLSVALTMAGAVGTPQPLAGEATIVLTAQALRVAVGHELAGTTGVELEATGSLSAPAAAVALAGSTGVSIATAGRIRLTSDPTGVYDVVVGHWVGATWTPLATLANAEADVVDQVLNDIDTAEFHMPVLDPEARTYLREELLGGPREVQIFRDGRCIFWGVPLTARANKTQVSFGCVDRAWWYTQRFFGPIVNHYGTNTDFEDGLTGWTAVNCTAEPSTTWRALGTKSAKLVCAEAGQDSYITQAHVTTTYDQPVFFAFKAMYHVVGDGWQGPAFEERGVYLEVRDEFDNLVGRPVWEPLTNSTPRDHHRPVRLETGITVPAGMTNARVWRRLYVGGGTVYVDATDIVTEESVGSRVTGDAANVIITRVNTYAQDPAQGKSSFNMGLAEAAGTFPHLIRIYQFHENGNIWEALKQYPREGHCDIDVQWDPFAPTTTELTLFPNKKGTFKAAGALTLSTRVVVDFSYDVDAAAITTAPRVLGQGEGADREIGYVVDTSALAGHVRESVSSAPLDAAIDSLQSLAAKDLADSRTAVRVPEFPVPAEYVLGAVNVGDTVPVSADYGYVQLAAEVRRVVRMRIDCRRDVVAVGVN